MLLERLASVPGNPSKHYPKLGRAKAIRSLLYLLSGKPEGILTAPSEKALATDRRRHKPSFATKFLYRFR
jgi:hypothetical protein